MKKWIVIALCLAAGLSAVPALAGDGAKSMPRSVQKVLYDAVTLMDQEKPGEAANLISGFLDEDKDGDKAGEWAYLLHFTRGNALYAAGDARAARASFEEAVKQNPGYRPAWVNLAVACHETGDAPGAAAAFEKAYDLEGGTEPDLLFSAAVSYLSAEQWAESSRAFFRLFAAHPGSVTVSWMECAVHAHLGNGRDGEAIALMERLVREAEGEKRRQWCEQLLHQYMSRNMYEKAMALARNLVNEEPGERRWWLLKAHLHLSRNEHKKALASLWAADAIKPWSPEERTLAADLYLALDVPARAVPLLTGAACGKPSFESLEKAVYALRRLCELQKALSLLDRHEKRFPAGRLCLLRADLLYEAGNYAEARKAYESAAGTCDSPGRAWLMAGYAALAGGDREAAGRAFRRAAKYRAQAAEARDMMERI